jgi:hypothetical protein
LKERSKELLYHGGEPRAVASAKDAKFFGSFFQKRTAFLPIAVKEC